MDAIFHPVKSLCGELTVPGDKSISHRSIIFGSIAKGKSCFRNFLSGEDCLSTIAAFRQMGITIDFIAPSEILVHGKGLRGLSAPISTLDAGNSGTTARLLLGLLSAQHFDSSLTGDDSLLRRPMKRVVEPLREMKASITGREDGRFLPLHIKGSKLSGIDYMMPIASAQVKSALILASLYADSPTVIHEPAFSRNHTELMLKSFGGLIEIDRNLISVSPAQQLYAQDFIIPGDISSAAFFITAGMILPGSNLTLKQVGLNPTRLGILEVYRKMGGNFRIENECSSVGEIRGDITVTNSQLKGITIEGAIIPRLIDEIPIIALAATQAFGTTVIRNAEELKVKESDRINSVVSMLKSFGAKIDATDDGMIISGPSMLKGTVVESHNDHRIAMTAAIGALIAQGETTIKGWEWVDISFPGFQKSIRSLVD